MEINKHIKDLLHLHDCVIIPGFGGFITNYQSSEIQKYQHVIYPPSKSVLFNKQLKANDGLLINQIMEDKKCSYKEAEQIVKKFATNCDRVIDNKGILLFPDVGKLYINASGNLIFLPELRKNFLTESFGLKAVSIDPNHQVHNEEKPRLNEISKEKQPTKNIKRKNRSGKRIEVTGLVLSILAIVLFSQLIIWDFTPERIKLQGLNILGADHITLDKETLTPDINKKYRALTIKEKTTNQLRTARGDASAEKAKVETGIGYYIVLGAFQDHTNASRLMQRVQSQNETVIIIKTATGFSRVAVYASADKSRALDKLQQYKTSNHPGSWMFIKEG